MAAAKAQSNYISFQTKLGEPSYNSESSANHQTSSNISREKLTPRPTTLAVDAPSNKLPQKLPRHEPTVAAETFPTPMEEPRKVIKAWYLGSLQVGTAAYFYTDFCYAESLN